MRKAKDDLAAFVTHWALLRMALDSHLSKHSWAAKNLDPFTRYKNIPQGDADAISDLNSKMAMSWVKVVGASPRSIKQLVLNPSGTIIGYTALGGMTHGGCNFSSDVKWAYDMKGRQLKQLKAPSTSPLFSPIDLIGLGIPSLIKGAAKLGVKAIVNLGSKAVQAQISKRLFARLAQGVSKKVVQKTTTQTTKQVVKKGAQEGGEAVVKKGTEKAVTKTAETGVAKALKSASSYLDDIGKTADDLVGNMKRMQHAGKHAAEVTGGVIKANTKGWMPKWKAFVKEILESPNAVVSPLTKATPAPGVKAIYDPTRGVAVYIYQGGPKALEIATIVKPNPATLAKFGF